MFGAFAVKNFGLRALTAGSSVVAAAIDDVSAFEARCSVRGDETPLSGLTNFAVADCDRAVEKFWLATSSNHPS